MININYGRNNDLIERCRPLADYSQFVSTVRELKSQGLAMDSAVHNAIRMLGEDSPIRDFLIAREAEVLKLCITEYNEKEVMEYLKEEAKEEGWEEGLREGATKAEANYSNLIKNLLSLNRIDDIRKVAEDPGYRAKLFAEFGI